MKSEDLDRLRETLRRGDPAADGRAPDAAETALLRARLLESAADAGHGRPRAFGPSFATAAAAAGLLVLTLGLAVTLRLDRRADRALDRAPGPERAAEASGGPALGAEAETPPRQIQFTTPGGTRIVWVLYPEPPVHP
ncbi:MAG TPA: hypothetical protein VM599_08060 [Thermoanaerobaculia bacterium]|nr:hypothetical protein [Thermoanaerobaculia bacterium]